MPYISEWRPNEIYFTHKGIRIFYTYEEDDGPENTYHFGTANDSSELDEDEDTIFDVRDLSTWIEPEYPPYITDEDSPLIIAEKNDALDKFFKDGAERGAIQHAIIAAIDDGSLAIYIKAAELRPKEIYTTRDNKEEEIVTNPSGFVPLCGNCKHWRDKAWTSKGWGICDNPKNELKVTGLSRIPYYVSDEQAQKELRDELEDGIRYPEDFGCLFFERRD